MAIALLAVGVDGLSSVLDDQPGKGIPFVIAVLLGALGTYLIMAFTPRIWGNREVTGSPR